MKVSRQKILHKLKGKCAYCGCDINLKSMQVDHLIPQRNVESRYHVETKEDALRENEVAGIYHFGNLLIPININYLKKIRCGENCSEVYSDDICPYCVSNLVRKDNFMKAHGHGTPCILIKKYENDSIFKDWIPKQFKNARQRLIHQRITERGIIETANKQQC